MTNSETPTQEYVEKSIDKHIADNGIVHSIIHTGSDENVDYYLVHYEEPYNGLRYRKERYFQVPKDGSDSVLSFRKQGINRRDVDGLTKAQLRSWARIDSVENSDRSRAEIREMEPLWIEL